MSKATEILTPVGRLVQGSPFEPQTLDAEGRPLVIKSGPNAGQPRQSYFVALAIPKSDPGVNLLYATIASMARAAFPQYFDAAGNCNNPKFAFKVTDGDSQVPNTKGRKPCDQEGFPGCWVFKFNNGFAPKCYKNGAELITNPEEIKCGYYVRIYATITGNESQQQPGVFLNVSMIQLVGYGEEIVFGPDAKEVFGATPAALPAGASATPLAPKTTIALPGAPALPTGMPAAPILPTNVQPARDFLNPGSALPPPPPLPPPVPVFDQFVGPDGVVRPKTAYLQAGYTEVQIAALKRA